MSPNTDGILDSGKHAELASSLNLKIMKKYVDETRKKVDEALSNVDNLTQLKIYNEILSDLSKAPELPDPELMTEGVTKITKYLKDLDEYESALSMIQEAHILKIQLRHVIPMLEKKKESEIMVVPTKKRKIEESDEILFGEKVESSVAVLNPEDKSNLQKDNKSEAKKEVETKSDHESDSDSEDDPEEAKVTAFLLASDPSKKPHKVKLSQMSQRLDFNNVLLCDNFVRMYNNDQTAGCFIFVVDGIGSLVSSVDRVSPTCIIRSLPWKISVSSANESKLIGRRNLAVFLYCDGVPGKPWSCFARTELILVSQKDEIENDEKRMMSRSFSQKHNNWGFKNFIDWDLMMDPSEGFVLDNKIVLQANIWPEEPSGLN